MSQNKIQVYVKRITANSLTGFIVRENTAKLQITLKIDEGIYHKIIEICEKNNYITLIVNSGIIIGVIENNSEIKVETIEQVILNKVLESGIIKKKELYRLVSEQYNISYSTFQKIIKELEASNTQIYTNYNNVMVKK